VKRQWKLFRSEEDEISSGSSFVCCCLGCRRRFSCTKQHGRGGHIGRIIASSQSLAPPLFRLPSPISQSISSFPLADLAMFQLRAYYLITVARVCGEIFLFYVNRVFMGY
jgi:hypothetical protein